MLLRINENTLIDPDSARIALVVGNRPSERQIWVVSVANPRQAIEVAYEFQKDLLDAMRLDLPGK